MASLKEMSMLGSLSMGKMAGRKFDKKETQELAERKGADVAALRLTKKLFTNSEQYKAIISREANIRQTWYKHTLPWDDSNWRIFTSDQFIPLTTEMRKAEAEWRATLQPFFEVYPFLVAHDKNVLNGLFNENDYPPLEKAKKRFYYDLEFQPVPDAEDFRVNLRDSDLEAIKKATEESVKRRVARAMEEPYHRLFDCVAHMASRLQGLSTCACRQCRDKTFTTDTFGDSLVDNIREQCEILPRLNITNDPELNALIEEVKASLTVFPATELRTPGHVRNTIAARAAEIQANMAGYFQVQAAV